MCADIVPHLCAPPLPSTGRRQGISGTNCCREVQILVLVLVLILVLRSYVFLFSILTARRGGERPRESSPVAERYALFVNILVPSGICKCIPATKWSKCYKILNIVLMWHLRRALSWRPLVQTLPLESLIARVMIE